MNGIGQKLRSDRGASITFALLLFLVCAVVSSVVIVAGTAAAGRMSELAEMDQRYYAVTSAAGLLRDELCGEGKKIIVTAAKNDAGEKTCTARYANEAAPRPKETLLTDASKRVVQSLSGESVAERTLGLTVSGVPAGADLSCTIVEAMLPGGMLEFKISAGPSGRQYTQRVLFASNTKKSVAAAAPGTQVTEVTWKLNRVEKVRAGEGGVSP